MSRVAVVTDSASDLPPEQAEAAGITVVPLLVTFGDKEYRAGVDLSAEEFWRELTAPGAPFPKTAAAAPGTFKDTFESLFSEGADEIVYVGVGGKLSATLGSAKVARDMLPERQDPRRRLEHGEHGRRRCSPSTPRRRLPPAMSGERSSPM